MKKYVHLSLVLILVLSMLAGCVGNDKPGGETPQQPDGTTGIVEQPPKTLTMMIQSHASWPYNADWYVWDLIEEKVNIKLDVTTVVGGDYQEKLNIVIASQDLPNIIHIMGSPSEINKYGADGALLDLLPHLGKMPNVKKYLEENNAKYLSYLSADGKLFAFPPGQGAGETNRRGWLYRKDIFEKHDLKIPETSDDLYALMKQIKGLYPDSYPYTWRGGLSSQISMFVPLWGTGWKAYFDHDAGKFNYGPIEDEFKEMVEYINKAFNEDLLPPDILTLTTAQWQNLVSTDKVFITTDYLTRIDTLNSAVREENPDFTIAYMKPIAMGSKGENKFTYSTIISNALTISSTNKELDATFRLFDFYLSDEGMELLSWGEEGKTYNVVNGERKFINSESIADIRNNFGLTTYGTNVNMDYNSHMSTFSPELFDAYEQGVKYDMREDIEPAFTEEEYEEFVHLDEALKKHKETAVAQFFIGSRSLDEWDQYVQETMNLGVERYLQLYDNAYQRTMEMIK